MELNNLNYVIPFMEIRYLVDFGMVVLIWCIQLVIYPGFIHMKPAAIHQWHGRYMFNVSLIVMPLMLTQVAAHIWSLWNGFEPLGLTQITLIAATWLLTFLKAVPLHNRIQKGIEVEYVMKSLVSWNWPRTILWTLVFLLDVFQEIY